jgi:hypothetical protein
MTEAGAAKWGEGWDEGVEGRGRDDKNMVSRIVKCKNPLARRSLTAFSFPLQLFFLLF